MVSEQRQRDPSAVRPLSPSPSSSESILASKAFLPLPTLPPPTPVLDRPSRPVPSPLGTLPHRLLGLHTVTGPGCMQQWQGTCSSSWQKALLPSPLGRDRNGGHPGTQKKGKQKEANQKWRRAIRAGGGGQRLPRAGQWGSPCECIRPGDWEWRGRPKEAMRAWRDSQEEGERAVMQLGTNLLLLYQILSQSIGVC